MKRTVALIEQEAAEYSECLAIEDSGMYAVDEMKKTRRTLRRNKGSNE